MNIHWPGVQEPPSEKEKPDTNTRRNTLGLQKLKTRKMLDERDEEFIDEILSRRSGS